MVTELWKISAIEAWSFFPAMIMFSVSTNTTKGALEGDHAGSRRKRNLSLLHASRREKGSSGKCVPSQQKGWKPSKIGFERNLLCPFRRSSSPRPFTFRWGSRRGWAVKTRGKSLSLGVRVEVRFWRLVHLGLLSSTLSRKPLLSR